MFTGREAEGEKKGGEKNARQLNYAPAKCHQPAVRVARTHFQRPSSVLVLRARIESGNENGWLFRGGYAEGRGRDTTRQQRPPHTY